MRVDERKLARSARAVAFACTASIWSLSVPPHAAAAATGPGALAALSGVWTGGGTMSLQNGTKERIRCRAQYVVTENGTNLQQSLRCDSDTDQIRINAHINDHGGSLSGGWAEEVQ